jgi:hypothetical protein
MTPTSRKVVDTCGYQVHPGYHSRRRPRGLGKKIEITKARFQLGKVGHITKEKKRNRKYTINTTTQMKSNKARPKLTTIATTNPFSSVCLSLYLELHNHMYTKKKGKGIAMYDMVSSLAIFLLEGDVKRGHNKVTKR